MPHLAGFDLLIEVARMAIERELLNTPLATDPNAPANDTLVPPFLLSRTVSLPGLTGLLNLKVTDLRLIAQPKTSLLMLRIAFEEGSLEAPGIALSILSGRGAVSAPLYFTQPAGFPTPQSSLVLDFAQTTSTLELDPSSSNQIDQAVGPVVGGAIRNALRTALTLLFQSQGLVNLGFSFGVVSNQNSTDMMVLTAVPQVSWIDEETLGIFGYHRSGATTGNMAWKTTSDLPPAPYPGFPWYPIAVLLSESSFQQLIACPAVRRAARDHVSGRYREAWINEERTLNNNQGDPTPAEIAKADSRLLQYLDSPAGQAEIAAATPAPCGAGQMDQRIKMPDPFADSTGYITWLSMNLGVGRIDIKAKAHAAVFCGRVSVELPLSIQPFIGLNNTIPPGQIQTGQPVSDVDANPLCGIAIGVMSAFLVGPFIGSVIAIVAVAVAESLAESILESKILEQNLPTPQMNGQGPQLPANVRLRELLIEPSGLLIRGVWEGMVNDPHKFDPTIHLYWRTTHEQSESVFLHPGTFEASCGGEPQTFRYTPHAWDTTVHFTLALGDVPRPLYFDDWWLWHDGIAHKLVPGQLTFPGSVLVPAPPNKETLENRSQIVVGVQGSNSEGYRLSFRAEDLNVPFEVRTAVRDGSGRWWWLGTNHQRSQGLTFTFDPEYHQFREECARHIIGVASRYKLAQEVPVWETVMGFENIVQDRLRGVGRNGAMGGAATVRQLMIDRPEMVKQLFRKM